MSRQKENPNQLDLFAEPVKEEHEEISIPDPIEIVIARTDEALIGKDILMEWRGDIIAARILRLHAGAPSTSYSVTTDEFDTIIHAGQVTEVL